MSIRAIDSIGDWKFGHGVFDLNTGEAEIEENIKTRLLSWKGDCFFALNDFVDWRSRLDVGQQINLKDEINRIILQTPGVVKVLKIDLNWNSKNRFITITYTIQTIYSQSFQASVTQNLIGG
jgi:hypothetical protein